MKIRVLLAITDGKPGADRVALSPGSLAPGDVPILENFDPSKVIGKAGIVVEGCRVFAECTVDDNISVAGLFPSIGFTVRDQTVDDNGFRTIQNGDLLCVSLHVSPNADERVPPIE